jgi:hypothetical protein
MSKQKHIITFLLNARKLASTTTSDMMVDKDNTVEDVFDTSETTGGLVAGIDNDVAEIRDKLFEYYTKTGNKRLLKRLEKLNNY